MGEEVEEHRYCVPVLVLDGWDVADGGVEAVVVVPADPLDDGEFKLGARLPDATQQQPGLFTVAHRVTLTPPIPVLRRPLEPGLRAAIGMVHELDVGP